ncbi:hypothetical protein E2562_001881 [Oryza meyeriana var. granulata]|uniref:Uncharacterized protein n=1 Tax=Oryza meyeriana var. granulata TaxID=110450 RepID=A0A6G1C3I3_9ORYZ|nr:hypothetical protein E2562_001881 [Oryza meyeriana var. granulata]
MGPRLLPATEGLVSGRRSTKLDLLCANRLRHQCPGEPPTPPLLWPHRSLPTTDLLHQPSSSFVASPGSPPSAASPPAYPLEDPAPRRPSLSAPSPLLHHRLLRPELFHVARRLRRRLPSLFPPTPPLPPGLLRHASPNGTPNSAAFSRMDVGVH